jgi:hypothetical protein
VYGGDTAPGFDDSELARLFAEDGNDKKISFVFACKARE